MGDGFEVDTAALRAAAGQIQPKGAEVTSTAGTVQGSVQPAATANPGYALSMALTGFAQQLSTAMTAAGQALTGHAENLTANADAYDRGDEGNAGLFRPR